MSQPRAKHGNMRRARTRTRFGKRKARFASQMSTARWRELRFHRCTPYAGEIIIFKPHAYHRKCALHTGETTAVPTRVHRVEARTPHSSKMCTVGRREHRGTSAEQRPSAAVRHNVLFFVDEARVGRTAPRREHHEEAKVLQVAHEFIAPVGRRVGGASAACRTCVIVA